MEPKRGHLVIIPAPFQGHINPMLKLANLLHSRGFYITFVHTEFNFARLNNSLDSGSPPPSLHGHLDFSYETIPDGLPPNNKRGFLDLPDLCLSLGGEPKKAYRCLLMRLLASPDIPAITWVISDAVMNFTFGVAKELGIKELLFYTPSACGVLGYLHYDELVKRGYFPLKDESCLTNGYLDTPINWIPGLIKGAKLKHIPSFIITTNPHDTLFNYNAESIRNALRSGTIILNTFDDLEGDALDAISSKIPNLYTIGPLLLLSQQAKEKELLSLESSLWKEEANCLEWLDKRNQESVIYVNYGSIATLTPEQLQEFAWGLANSKYPFLWVIRSDLASEGSGVITDEYLEEITGRGLLSSWCPQEKVLHHPSVAVFLTHCGWNSTLESICEGVPMICWPFFAEQQMNSLYACKEWGIGMEIKDDVRREEVEAIVREVMEGEMGKEMKEKAKEWKRKAENATKPGGTSHVHFDNLVRCLTEQKHHDGYLKMSQIF